jgi:hypothetical protein
MECRYEVDGRGVLRRFRRSRRRCGRLTEAITAWPHGVDGASAGAPGAGSWSALPGQAAGRGVGGR